MARNEKPFPIKGGLTVPVPSFVVPAPKPDVPLLEPPPGMRLRLRDAGTHQVLDEQPLQPAIAMPDGYLEATQARFVTGLGGRPIAWRFVPGPSPRRQRPTLPDPADHPVGQGDLPGPTANHPRGGSRACSSGGATEALSGRRGHCARTWRPCGRGGAIRCAIDGLDRSFGIRPDSSGRRRSRSWRRRSGPSRPFPAGDPGQSRESPPVGVAFQVERPRRTPRLVFELGGPGRASSVVLPGWEDEAKRRHLGFDAQGGGAGRFSLFEAAVEDWIKEFDIPQTRGRHRLQASLIDPRNRRIIQTWGMDLDLDDLPPQIVSLEVVKEIGKGTSQIEARATVRPTSSGSRKRPSSSARRRTSPRPRPRGKTIPGKPQGGDPNTWKPSSPLPRMPAASSS